MKMSMLDVLFCYFIVLGGVVGVSLAQEGGTPSMFEVINLSLNFPMLSERDFATEGRNNKRLGKILWRKMFQRC